MKVSSKRPNKEVCQSFLGVKVHSWDDFLDFSRMSKPKDGWTWSVLKRRVAYNMNMRFQGNYIWISIVTFVAVGILVDRKLLFAYMLSLLFWIFLSWLTAYKSSISNVHYQNPFQQKLPEFQVEPTSINKRGTLFLFGTASFYMFSVSWLGCFVTCGVLFMSLVHAIARPVLNENDSDYPKHFVASDGFVDSTDNEETLEFIHSELRQRSSYIRQDIPGIVKPITR